MRIGVISDTHIPDRAEEIPPEILEAFKKVDMIIHTGDFVGLEVLKKLRNVCSDVHAVYGNMDPEEIRNVLPEKEIVKVGKFQIGIAHGYGHPNKLVDFLSKMFADDAVDAIVFGHSHVPMNEKKGKILFFNPGSPTDKIFSKFNSYGILEINDSIAGKIVKI